MDPRFRGDDSADGFSRHQNSLSGLAGAACIAVREHSMRMQ
jgi:hypothetical protein